MPMPGAGMAPGVADAAGTAGGGGAATGTAGIIGAGAEGTVETGPGAIGVAGPGSALATMPPSINVLFNLKIGANLRTWSAKLRPSRKAATISEDFWASVFGSFRSRPVASTPFVPDSRLVAEPPPDCPPPHALSARATVKVQKRGIQSCAGAVCAEVPVSEVMAMDFEDVAIIHSYRPVCTVPKGRDVSRRTDPTVESPFPRFAV